MPSMNSSTRPQRPQQSTSKPSRFTNSSENNQPVLDEFGNVVGGLRSP